MKPNIVIVMTDQQRHDLRKAAGYSLDTMPFLDSFAEKGVDFSQAYTPNPTCMPARVSMFTGRYCQSHCVRTNHNAADAVYTEDLLDVLKQQGYTTALCGKNHSHHKVEEFDFHEVNGHLGVEDRQHLSQSEQKLDDYLKTLKFIDSMEPSPGDVSDQLPYRNVSSALKFVDEVKETEKPFFAWVSFAEPHNPYQVCEPYFSMFPPHLLPPLSTGPENLEGKGPRYTWIRGIWEKVLGTEIEQRINRDRSNYLGMLRLIDDQFKRLIEGLEQRNLLDNTLVIFLSDHGDFMGEYGLVRKGPDLSDVLTHIPMIWRGPGIANQGRVGTNFVNIVDILPTLCDYLGVQTPFGVQGKSLRPLLENTAYDSKEYETAYSETGFGGLYWDEEDNLTPQEEKACHLWETFDCLNTWTQCGQVRMLRKGEYKIQVDMLGTGYLYNLKDDPMEINNLWDGEMYQAIKADMLTELTAAMLRATDPIPAPRNRYRTKLHPKGFWFDKEFHASDPGVLQVPKS